jgi:DnaJ family protein A protein 2
LKADESCPFERHGDDLIYAKKINLLEALTGFEFTLTHLDDRVLLIKNKPGEVVKPGK